MSNRRVAITGMSINTPLADTLDGFRDALMCGRSAISRWKAFPTDRVYSKVGGDLSHYDIAAKIGALEATLPAPVHKRRCKLASRGPWTTRLSMLLAVDAWSDARLLEAAYDPDRIAVVVAGHNLNALYQYSSRIQF